MFAHSLTELSVSFENSSRSIGKKLPRSVKKVSSFNYIKTKMKKLYNMKERRAAENSEKKMLKKIPQVNSKNKKIVLSDFTAGNDYEKHKFKHI